jgi:hypothetical protein
MEASKKKEEKKEKPDMEGEDHEDWEALEEEGDDEQHDELERMGDDQESKVGSTLSEMTTKNVIILVLTLLLGLPSMSLDRSRLGPPSAHYGADRVWTLYLEYVSHHDVGKGLAQQWPKNSLSEVHLWYEQSLLHYIFYHNWFAQPSNCMPGAHCVDEFLSHAFWIGIEGKDSVTVEKQAKLAQVRRTSMHDFQEDLKKKSDYIFNFIDMPEHARDLLVQPWNIVCDDEEGNFFQGTSLLRDPIEGLVKFPVSCPQDLRSSETMKFVRRICMVNRFTRRTGVVRPCLGIIPSLSGTAPMRTGISTCM